MLSTRAVADAPERSLRAARCAMAAGGAALAAGGPSLGAVPLMRGALNVRRAATFARYGALLFAVHRGKAPAASLSLGWHVILLCGLDVLAGGTRWLR
jgi:hypothetical protein